jgi:hypothetical protein
MLDSIYLVEKSYRLMLLNGYCTDIFYTLYLDSIKIQSCEAAKRLRALNELIPKEYHVFEVSDYNFIEFDKSYSNKVNPFLYRIFYSSLKMFPLTTSSYHLI